MGASDWQLRDTAPDLAARYRAEGLWTDETFGSALAAGLAAHPGNEIRVWSAGRPYRGTFADVGLLARRLAGGLRARGIGPGDVVAFQLPNWVEAAATFWGVTLTGAVLVPIVHFYGAKELRHILRESGARALVTADRFAHQDFLANLDAVRPDAPELELVVLVGDSPAPSGVEPFAALVDADPVDGAVTVDPAAPAVVAYTSGTTSNPKGVVHTSRSLLAEVLQSSLLNPNVAGDRPMLIGAPVGHAIGMLGGLLGPVLRGNAVHLTDVWDPGRVLAAMVEGDLTSGSGSTYFLTSLLDHPDFGPKHLQRMGFVGLGGSAIPAAVAERATALGLTLTRSYGSSEHPSVTGSSRTDPAAARLYTDGGALAGVDLRLVDDGGRDVEPGTAGEILSRGPELFAGYTDPSLTALAVDGDGWFASGDVGVLDEHGWLLITDRKKDIIIRGGENISAAEIEELLVRLPGVAEVAVVAAPDARLGEHACAYVRVLDGVTPPTLDDVKRHLDAAGLARQKWPEELRAVDELPRTPSGKIKKFALRDALRAERSPAEPR